MTSSTLQLAARPRPVFAEQDAGGAPIRPTLHHVQLKTTNLQPMIEWYSEVLGLVVSHRADEGVWLTNDDANHRLAMRTSAQLRDDPDKLRHTGMHHTAWEYASLDELLATYDRLKGQDILPHRTVNHGPITSFYYVDPDGNSVELQVDNFGDWTESIKFFRTEEFARDPLGPGVDPEAMIEARAKGVSPQEVNQRSYAGEYPPKRPNDQRIPLSP